MPELLNLKIRFMARYLVTGEAGFIGSNIAKRLLELAGDILHSRADISKVKKFLGYTPKVEPKEGLIKIVEWFKKNEDL